MGWFKKKESDPISERARALNERIAALEAQIKKLDSQKPEKPEKPEEPGGPKLRSTTLPQGSAPLTRPAPVSTPPPRDPIFEDVDQRRIPANGEEPGTPEHYNDLGVRKYDLAAFFRRIKNHLRGPATNNPKLVNYLAAGSLQGLRPMRYEKRVARNRFIVLAAVFLVVLLGIIAMILHRP